MEETMKVSAVTNTTSDTKLDGRKSLVDTLFDTLTLKTAKGLIIAKDALETVARWLDTRAKLVGELATKLSAGVPSTSASENAS